MSKKSLFVGNLNYQTNAEGLEAAFADYGGSNARVIEGRGFGFVDVDADRAADATLERDNYELDGRKIRVSEARPREDRGGGGGGYGGGGGGRGGYGGGGGRDRGRRGDGNF
jgi:RNA recognition motif-containing protein